jgi:hypothetical protein
LFAESASLDKGAYGVDTVLYVGNALFELARIFFYPIWNVMTEIFSYLLGCGAKIIAMIKLIGLIYGMEQLLWKRVFETHK